MLPADIDTPLYTETQYRAPEIETHFTTQRIQRQPYAYSPVEKRHFHNIHWEKLNKVVWKFSDNFKRGRDCNTVKCGLMCDRSLCKPTGKKRRGGEGYKVALNDFTLAGSHDRFGTWWQFTYHNRDQAVALVRKINQTNEAYYKRFWTKKNPNYSHWNFQPPLWLWPWKKK